MDRSISPWLCVLASLLGTAPLAWGDAPLTQSSHPFPGITFTAETRQDPPLHLYWVQADLTNPAVHVRLCTGGASTEAETTLLTVSKIAQRDHLNVAVNGSFFSPRYCKVFFGHKLPYFEGNPAWASGWTAGDGQLWTTHPLAAYFPSLLIGRDGRARIDRLTAPPPDVWQIVSGCDLVVRDGQPSGADDPPAPHTGAGLDKDGKTLTLFVADGRRPGYSLGISTHQLGRELARLGCYKGICLDGGGSSTMVIRRGERWPVVNTPSDGHDLLIPFSLERPVANALGISSDN